MTTNLTTSTAKFFCLALLLLIGATWETGTAAEKVHQIDRWTQQAAANAKSTGDEIAYQEQALQKWDAEMNMQYKKLMSELKPGKQQRLLAAQVQWLKFRDAELKLINDIYLHKEGSMYAPMQAASRARITRERAILLGHYSEILNDI